MFIAPLRHCRPKGVKWALHAHNEAREEGTVLHARSEKMRTSGCVSLPHARLKPPKKGLEQKRMFLSCARAVKKRKMGCCASFPHSRLEPKHLFLSRTRAAEKIRTSGCASLPHSRLELKRVFLSCTRAVTPFETSGFTKPRLCCTRAMKPGAESGFFVERASLFWVTPRSFFDERPC